MVLGLFHGSFKVSFGLVFMAAFTWSFSLFLGRFWLIFAGILSLFFYCVSEAISGLFGGCSAAAMHLFWSWFSASFVVALQRFRSSLQRFRGWK